MPVQPASPGSLLLDHYREIECAAARMLEAALDDDWPRVARIERAIRELADRLQAAAEHCELRGDERRERLRIVKRLLLLDAEVRRLADPSLHRLEALLRPRSNPGAIRASHA